ncbi:hemagglutinin repeat-containing protein [uncultured Cedecea sp.]|uniref:two-partner secretion domain-containing protein n=1 Tax=uncultured Cedecea sp. TaxID=988762 RepID=UPI00261E127E|nr:hemagglutinin repeat-containing protein [uncultured Cedecea sp.]
MNKHCYRIIFNRARQMLMVVADIAKSRVKTSSAQRTQNSHSVTLNAILKPLAWSLALASGSVVLNTQAAIVADGQAPGNQQPTIIAGANGTPQVNIQTPNNNGVSHNKYQNFDVDKNGAILNNSAVNTQTQLGGLVTGNPWLAKGEANVILNEVNSANPSKLNGFVEVAGKRADVIIANPAGITCSGCGFINANKTTLAAAQVLLEQGKIAGFEVKNGQIAVTGNGLNDEKSDYTQLIARAVKINAKLHAKDLTVTTGKNRTDANGKVISTESVTDSAEDFAIDVANLGGMYANKIRLVGTEKGLGVRNAGHIGATVGNISLSADGKISNTGVMSANQDIAINSQQAIDNQGTLLASKNIQLTARNDIINANKGQVIAGQNIHLDAAKIQSDQATLLAAGLDSKGQLTTAGSLTVQGKNKVALQGDIIAKDSLTVTGSELNLSHSSAQAKDIALTATTGDIRTQNTHLVATTNARLTAQKRIDNQQGEIVADTLTLSAQEAINNTQGHLIAKRDFTLNSKSLNNSQGVLEGQSRLKVQTGELDNRQGIISGKTVAINTQGHKLINQATADGQGIFAQQALDLNTGELSNYQGRIQGSRITLDTNAKQVNNSEGEILATETLGIVSGELDNKKGLIQAKKQLTINTQNQGINNDQTTQTGGILSGAGLSISSGQLSNQQGLIQGTRSTTLTTKQLNNQQGQVLSGGNLTINTQQQVLFNQKGTLASHGELGLNSGDIHNAQGTIQGQAGIYLRGHQIDNQSGILLSQADLHIEGTSLNNTQGIAQSQTNTDLIVQNHLNNTQGKILSGNSLNIQAESADNHQGTLQGLGDVTLTLENYFANTQGWVKANKTLTITSQKIDNNETAQARMGIEGQNILLTAKELSNQQGAVRSGQKINANISQLLNNIQGMLSAGSQLNVSDDVKGEQLNLANDQGVMVSNGSAEIAVNQLTGNGKLLAQKDLSLSVNQAFTHTGRIQAGERLAAHFQQGLTSQGLISSLGDLSLTTTYLINSLSGEITGNNTHISASGSIHNTGLIDSVFTHIIGQSLYNLGTGKVYGDAIAIAVKTLVNDKQDAQSAVIAGRESVNIAVGELLNRDHGLIYSDGDLAIGGELDDQFKATGHAKSVKNHSASIEAAGNLILKTQTLENKDIHLQLTDNVVEVSSEHFEWFDFGNGNRYKIQPRNGNQERYAINEDGSLNTNVGINYETSNRWRMFEYGNITKDFYEYNYDRKTYETQVVKQDAALITSGKNLTLDGQSLNNENSRIVAGQHLVLTGSALNNEEAQGIRRVIDEGETIYRYKGGGTWSTRTSTSKYQGENSEQSLALNLMEVSEQAGGITQIPLDAVKENQLGQQAGEVSDSSLNGEQGQDITTKSLKEGSDVVIKTVGPNITLPDNSLFILKPGSDSQYLIETDPRFTNKKKWLSSIDIITSDQLHKRLGDGYYEQRLVREQLINATGQRLFANYKNDEEQYLALLNSGVAFGKEYNLIPGVALSANQMANLTTDIVWLVNKEITLPDGRVELVSVPQVYVRAREGDLSGNGALLGGKTVLADITGSALNSGEISSRELTDLRADDIKNSGRLQGNDIALTALKDISNTGGEIRGTNRVSLSAGRNITSETVQRGDDKSAWLDRPASIYVTGDNGELTLQAIQNINITASSLGNLGEQGKTTISAGKDITLDTGNVGSSFDYTHNGSNYYRGESSREVGAEIHTKGDLTLSAGQDISSKAAQVSSEGTLNVNAVRDVNLVSGTEASDYTKHTKHTSKGFLSSTTKESHDEISERTALGSIFSGKTVKIASGNDINIQGSNVLGTDDVKIKADRQLNIGTSDEARHETHMSKTTKSGLLSSGGLGFTVGKQAVKQTTDTDSNQKKGSVIGSTAGSIDLAAGDTVRLHGSDVIAAKDASITGSDIHITTAENTRTDITTVETKQSGLSVSLSGAVGSALNTAVETAQTARKTDDGQLKALQGIKAGLKLEQAKQAGQLASAQNPDSDASNNGSFGVNLSYGSSSSKSVTKTEQKTASGSSLTAGDNINLTATAQSGQGNILVQGSTLNADKNISLTARNDIALNSAANTQVLDSKNDSKGSSVGVGITAGQGGVGWNVNASMSKGSGFEKGNSQYNTDSDVKAGKTLTLNSGKDTTLTGAQASGETVKAHVGGDLIISSQQAIDKYDSKQQNVSVSGSGGLGNGSLSVSADKTTMHSDYQSVDRQTGINAGKGGFDIQVGDHTQLEGAAIRSEASKDKNRLDTGTIGFSDIENKAEFQVQHQSAGISSGGDIGGQLLTNSGSALLSGVNNQGKDSNITRSAVAEGDIIVRDTEAQKQNVDDLSRDTGNAHKKLDPLFDKEKEQKRLERHKLIAEIGQQISDIAVTDARINAIESAAAASDEERQAAKEELKSKGKNSDPAAVNDYLVQQSINDSGWGVGGDNTRIVDAGTALIQGLANGDINSAVANASAPYIANIIGQRLENKTGKLAAHAIANVALALVKDENALSQATGAVTAEATGMLAQELYGKKPAELTEVEKSTLSAFASLAAGIAGGLTGGNTQDALNAAQAGKTTIENNYLSSKEARQLDQEMQDCKASGGDCNKIVEKYIDISNKNSKELIEACTGGGVACVTWQELIQGATNVANDAHPSQIRLDEKLKDPTAAALVNYLNSTDLRFLQDNITQGDRILSVVSDPTSWPVAIMGGKAIISNGFNKGKEQLIAVGASATGSAVIQYGVHGEAKLSDVIGAGIIGAITAGKGYNPTVTWNAAGGYYQAELKGDDPFLGALLSKAGAATGYAAGNILKVPADKIFNPVSKQYEWVPTGVWTITKPAPQNSLPSILGNTGNAAASGGFTEGMNEALKNKEEGQ